MILRTVSTYSKYTVTLVSLILREKSNTNMEQKQNYDQINAEHWTKTNHCVK